MPYIKRKERTHIDVAIDNMPLSSPGELNYSITRMILNYVTDQKDKRGTLKYQDINDVLGAIEGAKLEFYRRFAARYENDKKKENGDVY